MGLQSTLWTTWAKALLALVLLKASRLALLVLMSWMAGRFAWERSCSTGAASSANSGSYCRGMFRHNGEVKRYHGIYH